MVQTFLVALIAAICRSDRPFFGMMMLHRPLIVSTLVGIIFGDIKMYYLWSSNGTIIYGTSWYWICLWYA